MTHSYPKVIWNDRISGKGRWKPLYLIKLGKLKPDPSRFPSGILDLSNYIHKEQKQICQSESDPTAATALIARFEVIPRVIQVFRAPIDLFFFWGGDYDRTSNRRTYGLIEKLHFN